MIRKLLLVLLSILLLSACSSRSTSDDYAEACAIAEKERRLVAAEQACSRALSNLDPDKASPAVRSQRLYELGRIKRQLGGFGEAEELLKQSLAIEEKLSPVTDPKVGRRLIELSFNLARQKKWVEGAPYLERAAPAAAKYAGADRVLAAFLYAEYARWLRPAEPQLAARFDAHAAALRKE